jgi:hypothetical protein
MACTETLNDNLYKTEKMNAPLGPVKHEKVARTGRISSVLGL